MTVLVGDRVPLKRQSMKRSAFDTTVGYVKTSCWYRSNNF
jgi:hypothetical protein